MQRGNASKNVIKELNNDSCTPSVQQSYNTPSQGVGPTMYGAFRVDKFGAKTYMIVSFSLVVNSLKNIIQDIMIDLNSSGLNPTQIRRPIR